MKVGEKPVQETLLLKKWTEETHYWNPINLSKMQLKLDISKQDHRV